MVSHDMTDVNTPLDLVDWVSNRIIEIVQEQNEGRDITGRQFAAAHQRAFRLAFDQLLVNLRRDLGEEKAGELQREMLQQLEQAGAGDPQ